MGRHGSDSSWSYDSSPDSPPLATPPHQHPLSTHGDTYVSDDLSWQHDADWDPHAMGSCQRVVRGTYILFSCTVPDPFNYAQNTVELQFSMQAHHLHPNDHADRSCSYPMSNVNVHGAQGMVNRRRYHTSPVTHEDDRYTKRGVQS